MKAYRKQSGIYIEVEDNIPVSSTMTQVALRPSKFHVFSANWNTDPMNPAVCWVLDTNLQKADLKQQVSAKRYDVEVAGVNFTYRTVQVPISTSRDSQAKIDAARNMVKDTVWVENASWKCLDGVFRPMTSAEVLDMVAAVRLHIKATYDVEATKFAEIDATGTTDISTGWPATANTTTSTYFQK